MSGTMPQSSGLAHYAIRFPVVDRNEDQDSEFFELHLGSQWLTIRLHDYHEIYKHPGLYEQLFYGHLKCCSPQQVIGLLRQTLADRQIDPELLSAIDLGAGNGMVAEEMKQLGVGAIIGVDILPEARMAALRDRPQVYADYLVADLTKPSVEDQRRLREPKPNLLVTVAALGFGDIPTRAFVNAFNAIETPGWLAFNIRDAFLNTADRSGFSRLIRAMTDGAIIQVESWKRYVHRQSIHERPIEYIALVARKLACVPEALVERVNRPTIDMQVALPAVTASQPRIEFRHVSKNYSGTRDALVDFNLTVHSGELVALVGESGSGKTTALKLVNRLINPSGGGLYIDGLDANGEDPVLLRRRIGYVFQQVGLFPHLTIGENIAITPRLLGWPAMEIAERVDELLKLVGLPPEEYRLLRPNELSGGQQQRIGFARALAARPSILLLDEPFGALDPLTRDGLQREFAVIHRQLKLTSILVTHDMAEALLLADRIAVMREGRLLQIGTAHELLNAPADSYVANMLDTPCRQAERLEKISQPTNGGSLFFANHKKEEVFQ